MKEQKGRKWMIRVPSDLYRILVRRSAENERSIEAELRYVLRKALVRE